MATCSSRQGCSGGVFLASAFCFDFSNIMPFVNAGERLILNNIRVLLYLLSLHVFSGWLGCLECVSGFLFYM